MQKGTNGAAVDVLVLGCESSGKTMLVKQLKNLCKGETVHGSQIETLATCGVELDQLVYQKKNKFIVREVGGSLMLTWKKYLKDCRMIIYVVDASDPTQIAASCMEFFRLLNDEDTRHKPFLLLLNKTDMPSVISRTHFEQLTRMGDLLRECNDPSYIGKWAISTRRQGTSSNNKTKGTASIKTTNGGDAGIEKLRIEEVSAWTSYNLDSVLRWILQCCSS